MKKSLLALAVATAGVCLIAPKFIGDNADAELTRVIAEVSELPGYQLTLVSKEKGWFASSATLNIAFDPTEFDPQIAQSPEAMAMFENLQFDFEVDMQHGPILAEKGLGLSDIKIRIPNTSEAIKNAGELVENIYQFDGKLSLLGGLTYMDSISPLEMEFDGQPGKLTFSGYEGEAKNTNGELDYAAKAGSLNINSPMFDFAISDIATNWKGDFDLAKLTKGIYGNMETSFRIGKMEATQVSQPVFGMQDLEISIASVADDNDVADMKAAYLIKQLDTPIEKFTDVELGFEFNNLSQNAMSKYADVIASLQTQELNEDEFLETLKPFVIDLMSAKPEIKITNIGFTTAAGTMKSQADVKLANYDIDESNVVDKSFWEQNLVLNSGLSLPTALATDLMSKNTMLQMRMDPNAAQYTPEQLQEMASQQAQMMVNGFMQGGFLVEENGELTLNFNVKDGIANLNGQEIPLAALLPAQ